MAGDHPTAGRFARLVGVEAAVDLVAAMPGADKAKVRRANSRRRDADALPRSWPWSCVLQLETTDGVNRGFAEDDSLGASIADPEVARVPAGARREASPDAASRATQLGADRTIGLSRHHQEHRVAAAVGVQLAIVDQRSQDRLRRDTAAGEGSDALARGSPGSRPASGVVPADVESGAVSRDLLCQRPGVPS